MDNNKLDVKDKKTFHFEVGLDKDNPIYQIEYQEVNKMFKKEKHEFKLGWNHQIGKVTDRKGQSIDYESEFSAFNASLEYLFDSISQGLLKGPFGVAVESLSNMNFSLSQHTTAKTQDLSEHEIQYSIDAIAGVIPYKVSIDKIDGKDFNGRLPENIENHICKFNNLNRALKDLKRTYTYDRPDYFHGGLFEEMFQIQDLINENVIEYNNEISRNSDVKINEKQEFVSSYDVDNYHIDEALFETALKTNKKKFDLGNLEMFSKVKRGDDELILLNKFSVVNYDPKDLSKYGQAAIQNKFLEKVNQVLVANAVKSINLTFNSDIAVSFKDKNGNTIDATMKAFMMNIPNNLKINKINGKEVTKIPKELADIVDQFNKPFEGFKYYFDNRDLVVDQNKFTKFLQTNYKRVLDVTFDLNDKIKEIDVSRKDNLEYVSDYKLSGSDRQFDGINIRTEKGMFTRADKATFTSADGRQVEVKVSSFFNGKFPTFTVNSIDGEKQHIMAPLRIHLKDKSIDNLILTAKGIVENMDIQQECEDLLSDNEKNRLLDISQKQMDDIVAKALSKLPVQILGEFAKKFTVKMTKQLNNALVINGSSNSIKTMIYNGRLTKEMIQGFYNQNPNLETIINDGKKINVMDYIDESLDEKISKNTFVKNNSISNDNIER